MTSEINQRFHFHIYRSAGSQVLIPVVESLWLQSGPVVRAAAHIHDEQGGLAATNHHWTLIEALEARNEEAAVNALSNDIGRSFDLVRGRLDAGEEALAIGRESLRRLPTGNHFADSTLLNAMAHITALSVQMLSL